MRLGSEGAQSSRRTAHGCAATERAHAVREEPVLRPLRAEHVRPPAASSARSPRRRGFAATPPRTVPCPRRCRPACCSGFTHAIRLRRGGVAGHEGGFSAPAPRRVRTSAESGGFDSRPGPVRKSANPAQRKAPGTTPFRVRLTDHEDEPSVFSLSGKQQGDEPDDDSLAESGRAGR